MMKFQFLSENRIKESLKTDIKILKPLHKPLGSSKVGDWLREHEESGQTFQEYLQCKPVLPRGKRRVLYILPLGSFSDNQRKIITLTAEFMEAFFNLQTVIKEEISLLNTPSYAQRIHPRWGDHQILTSYVMRRILKPRIPSDAAAYIAFTTKDLWPGEGWNFVFGQASLVNRIGVFSIYRYGNPDLNNKEFQICLLRTVKTGAHEISHIFSLEHCILYECLMNGSNSQAESDRKPLACCPECMAKISWAIRTSPLNRFQKLKEFCNHNGFSDEAKTYQNFIVALTASNLN